MAYVPSRPRMAWLMASPLICLSLTSTAQAQDDAEEAAPEAAPEPAPEAAPMEDPAPADEPVAMDEPAAPAEAEPAAESSPISLSMFADAYFAFQSNEPGTLATTTAHRAYAGQGPSGLSENGFSLSFIGLDASYSLGEVSATASLRYGSSVPIFHGNDPSFGIDNITQGYLTWTPGGGALSLDLGMFGTIFGAEVAESWQNLNYTRGALYYYGQPFWHTGLRAGYQVSDSVGLTFMVVNGTNDISETQWGGTSLEDQTPTVAAQVAFSPSDDTSIVLGGMRALDVEDNDDGGFDTFFDLVATHTMGPLNIVLNADYVITDRGELDARTFLGLSGALGYALSDSFGVAGRFEYLTDDSGDDGVDPWTLMTGTATLDFKPVPNLIIRVDGRVEKSSEDVFGADLDPTGPNEDITDTWFTGVLGVVVTTDP